MAEGATRGSGSCRERETSALTSGRCEDADVDEGVLRMLLAKMCPKAKRNEAKFKENEAQGAEAARRRHHRALRATWPRLGWPGLVWPRLRR